MQQQHCRARGERVEIVSEVLWERERAQMNPCLVILTKRGSMDLCCQ